MPEPDATKQKPNDNGQIGEMLQLVKDYARQEALDPIKGAKSFIVWGLAGAFLIATGCVFLVLGLLRMLQTELHGTFRGYWMSTLPYVAAFLFALLVIVVAALRIPKGTLQKKEKS